MFSVGFRSGEFFLLKGLTLQCPGKFPDYLIVAGLLEEFEFSDGFEQSFYYLLHCNPRHALYQKASLSDTHKNQEALTFSSPEK